MRRIRRIIAIGCMSAMHSLLAHSSDVIHFAPGPDSIQKMITPWGDFIAEQNGDTIWVGTVQEWNDRRADGVAKINGDKHVELTGGDTKARTYISTDYRSLDLGNGSLYEVTTSILFGVPANPGLKRLVSPSNSEYVEILWLQSKTLPTAAQTWIQIGENGIQPNGCARSGEFFHCGYTIPRSLLTSEAKVVFFASGKKPEILKLNSIAQESYANLALKYKRKRGEPIDELDYTKFEALRKLDPELPAVSESIPGAPAPSKLKLEICRPATGYYAENIKEHLDMLGPIINFSAVGSNKPNYNKKTIYTVFTKGNSILAGKSCFTAIAKLTQSFDSQTTPDVGDTLKCVFW